MISEIVCPRPTSTFSAIWRRWRSIQLNAIMRTKWNCFGLKLKVPSWRWRGKARISSPVRLMWAHRPVPTGCIRPMWPCSHTTKGPRFSYLSKYSKVLPGTNFSPHLHKLLKPQKDNIAPSAQAFQNTQTMYIASESQRIDELIPTNWSLKLLHTINKDNKHIAFEYHPMHTPPSLQIPEASNTQILHIWEE